MPKPVTKCFQRAKRFFGCAYTNELKRQANKSYRKKAKDQLRNMRNSGEYEEFDETPDCLITSYEVW